MVQATVENLDMLILCMNILHLEVPRLGYVGSLVVGYDMVSGVNLWLFREFVQSQINICVTMLLLRLRFFSIEFSMFEINLVSIR